MKLIQPYSLIYEYSHRKATQKELQLLKLLLIIYFFYEN